MTETQAAGDWFLVAGSCVHLPLTFLAGIYGMNFEHMPELHVRWAYPTVWLAMGVTAVGMLLFFYRRGWIGKSKLGERNLVEQLLENPSETAKRDEG